MPSLSLAPVPGFCIKSSADGRKVFVNIAWDKHVPPPPAASEQLIARAIHGDDDPDPDAWYSRTLTDPEFKLFIIELALQRIEAQSSLVLSRHIATPNIASKGKLLPRTVTIPASLVPGAPPHIQELSPFNWSWSKHGTEIHIQISVPNLPRPVIEHATLDIEPRRFILRVPEYPILDVNLASSDAAEALTLKRQRPLLIDSATSQWRVADKMLVIVA
ncbi:hypothetical protein C0992_007024 [Termitomyces sp. T32_za158]|nr:hypothetical protein C0992_007024 [Termitomyces sp. T32_za158]